MYQILIHRQAKKKLQALGTKIRTQIVEQIQRLACHPDDNSLDIKRLHGRPEFRLRIGMWRVIFERDDVLRIIAIQKIGARGDIYK